MQLVHALIALDCLTGMLMPEAPPVWACTKEPGCQGQAHTWSSRPMMSRWLVELLPGKECASSCTVSLAESLSGWLAAALPARTDATSGAAGLLTACPLAPRPRFLALGRKSESSEDSALQRLRALDWWPAQIKSVSFLGQASLEQRTADDVTPASCACHTL